MRQVVASLVAPVPMCEVRRIHGADANRGFFALLVARSPWRPHAVRVGEGFRYPRRDGPHIRYLSEQEVADAYRNRFSEARIQLDRLDIVLNEGIDRLEMTDTIWLCTAIVPMLEGRMEITLREMKEVRGWALQYQSRILGGGAWAAERPEPGVGIRRLTLESAPDRETGKQRSAYAELHRDGAGFMALPVWRGWGKDESPRIRDQRLVEGAADMLGFLVHHQARSGAAGDALVAMAIIGTRPVELVHDRHMGLVQRVSGSRPLAETITSRHSIASEAIRTDPQELASAVRVVLADLLQGFGVPECLHITPQGELRRPMFRFAQPINWDTWAPGFLLSEENPG